MNDEKRFDPQTGEPLDNVEKEEPQKQEACADKEAVTQASTVTEPKATVEPTNDNTKTIFGISIASFVISGLFVIVGLYKLLAYKNDDDAEEYTNAYVGGDAYNYIINGTHATAWLVLATCFMVLAVGLLIVYVLEKNNKSLHE